MILLKADYKKYPTSKLEKLRMDEDEFYEKFDGCVLLQTCNRVEIYFDVDNLDEIDIDVDKFDILEGDEAVLHLLRLASGLESMIVGEDQILGQIKKSYLKAKELKKTTKFLDTIFLKAIHVGQRVRSETKINEGGVSIGSAAVELAEKIFGLKNKNVLLIGAGEIGTLVAKALKERHIKAIIKAIIIANRTYERAERLAKELSGIAIHFDKLKEALKYADIVISATGAPHQILTKEDLVDVGETIIIDIANPRDVDDSVRELPHIKLFTIDDLKLISEENLKKRKEEIPKVEKIIMEEFENLKRQIKKLEIQDFIKNFTTYIESIRRKEVEKAVNMLKNKNKSPEEILENFSKAFSKKIIYDFVNVIEERHLHGKDLFVEEVIKEICEKTKYSS
ncbi:glutamyl-tRNA reductase [Methanotorris igneus]|uniref:Glutamyl-tRNA reductase n=1 Tax=Methanotorris igneus (strain DSM 5666 / JCM 11834 / Kol 5) TaxID=880724 RepID=F6BAK4_METIK|nr:glutamyl-tRNA reductase [Methanotorris igneus]AEF97017.1 Glutamyl-tRNA reductase [Methanotorris igneus Kol 5]